MKNKNNRNFKGKRASLFLASMMAISSSAFGSDFKIIFDVHDAGAIDSSGPTAQEKSVSAWEELAANDDAESNQVMEVPSDWSNGIDWDRGCCGYSINALPDEPYPATTISGGIDLKNHGAITDISAFSNITQIEGGISLRKTGVNSLVPFSGATISEMTISVDRTGLSSLEGLEGLTKVKTLYAADNSLTSTKGLENLTKFGTLYLQNNDLSSIAELSGVRETGYDGHINVKGNPNLDDLSPLNGLEEYSRQYCNSGQKCTAIIVDDREYATKMSYSSVICQEIRDGKVEALNDDPHLTSSPYTVVDTSKICESP